MHKEKEIKKVHDLIVQSKVPQGGPVRGKKRNSPVRKARGPFIGDRTS